MRNFFRKIRDKRFNYTSLVEVELSRANLLHNLQQFQSLNETLQIAPVLKSNAYGHGLVGIAQILDKLDFPFLIVDSYYEALILHNEKIKTPILIIGYTDIDNITNNKLKDVIFTITNSQDIELLAKNITKFTQFNLKFNTGMNRQGIEKDVPRGTLDTLFNNTNIDIISICSHLASADSPDSKQNSQQIKNWNKLVLDIEDVYGKVKYKHLVASAGSLLENVPRGTFTENVARVGLGLYGLQSDNYQYSNLNLKPVISIYTRITSLRDVTSGDLIGYGGTYKVVENKKIATIPMGYYEGIDLRLSNQGFVKIITSNVPRGTYSPIIR